MNIRAAIIGLSMAVSATAAFASGFKIQAKIAIGGEGGWDYLTADSAARRLYVSHSSQVEVIDLDSLKPVGKIAPTPGVHGVAVAAGLGRGFISEGRADAVAVFDLLTLQKIAEIKTGKNPDSIVFDPATSRVFANNGRSDSSTVIDAKTNAVLATLALEGKPEFAVADGQGHVYVNLENKNSVSEIDSRGLRVDKTWALPGCEEPSSMAIDAAHRRLFIGCGNQVMAVVDADQGRVIATLPIGQHVDATVFDAGAGLIFNANGDGTMTVIKAVSADKFEVVENVATQKGARTVALDSKTHKLFLSTAQFGPPSPASAGARARPSIVPDTFAVLVVAR
jgi:YVTN family beta-propeller protein